MKLLRQTVTKYDCKLHAYCLMPNHYHLLLETSETSISDVMKALGQKYTGYYNARYEVDGPLFRGRFHSILIESARYFLQVCRYISLNPVKAKLAAKPEDYRWCSYRVYVGAKDDEIVTTERTLGYFTKGTADQFARFVAVRGKYDEDEEKVERDIYGV